MWGRLPSPVVSTSPRRWLLTGGIGSGKSEVRKLLAERGIRTIDADAIGHAVLAHEALGPVAARWPQVVFEGQIDRKALGRIVFADPEELAELEAITHPFIFGSIESELEGFSAPVVVEMPLIESGLGWPLIVVDATDEVRIQRVTERGMTQEDVQRRIAAQPARAEWLGSADVVVPNHKGLEDLVGVVQHLAQLIARQAGQP